MRKDIVALDEAVTVLEASRTMLAKSIDYVIVLSKGQPVGILTSHDIVMEAVAKEKIPEKVKISEIMSSPLVGVDPDADVRVARIVPELVNAGARGHALPPGASYLRRAV